MIHKTGSDAQSPEGTKEHVHLEPGSWVMVLVAEDDPDLLLLTTQVLRKAGYDVLEASTGKGCLEAVRAHHPDIVLLDAPRYRRDRGLQTDQDQ